jgi:signal peptidase II
MKKSHWVIALVLLVLILDQVLKIWVKTTFCLQEERLLLGASWARLNFIENPGMAFGLEIGGEFGKLMLSLFRLFAIGFLIYYLSRLIKRNVSFGLLSSFGLILAGAIGNMIDSAFYGLMFSASDYHCANGPAKFVAFGQGYAGFLHGKVVDMLFFPLLRDSHSNVIFFQPIFNIADSAITIGVVSILLFHRNYFNAHEETKPSTSEISSPTEGVSTELTANTDSVSENGVEDLTVENLDSQEGENKV